MRAIDSFKMDKGTFSVLSSFEEGDAAEKHIGILKRHKSVWLPSN